MIAPKKAKSGEQKAGQLLQCKILIHCPVTKTETYFRPRAQCLKGRTYHSKYYTVAIFLGTA